MARTISLIQRVQVASPCSASWDDMAGDDRVRFCSHCQLNVYNLSAMTEAEGEQLIIEREGKLCARIYRRRDGTVITRDCPIGVSALRRRTFWVASRCAAALVFIGAATAGAIASQRSWSFGGSKLTFLSGHRPSAFGNTLGNLHRWLSTVATPAPPVAGRIVQGLMMPPPVPPPAMRSEPCNAWRDAGER
jgi:hypothetical protein